MFPKAFTGIQQIVIEREVWEATVYRTSNEQLYALLDKCYSYYLLMASDTELAKQVKTDLETYINLNGYKFGGGSHTFNKIVKCVFKAERRRTSTYSLVLRAAIQANVKEGGIPEFIRSKGGVQEISLSSNSGEVTAKKLEEAKQAVSAQSLADVASEALTKHLDIAKVGQQFVIVATQKANGLITLNAVSYSSTAIKAALTDFRSKNKQQIANTLAERTKASNDDAVDQLIDQVA